MEDIKVAVKTVTIGKQERTPAEAAKVEAIKAMLDIIKPEEIDKFFLEVFNLAQTLQYRLQADPKMLLVQIEKDNG
jgi:hypothetical protein